jgi:hypothetical protein
MSRDLLRAVVLVEGQSDQAALVVLAERRGWDLAACGVSIMAMGGAQALPRFLDLLEVHAATISIAGLCDAHEEPDVRRALRRAGLGSVQTRAEMEQLGFFVCDADLEDELIRALGVTTMETILDEQGDLRAFRMFQRQPAQRQRAVTAQLRRFLGTQSGRKLHYARVLTMALDLARVPAPLDALLAYVCDNQDQALRPDTHG